MPKFTDLNMCFFFLLENIFLVVKLRTLNNADLQRSIQKHGYQMFMCPRINTFQRLHWGLFAKYATYFILSNIYREHLLYDILQNTVTHMLNLIIP